MTALFCGCEKKEPLAWEEQTYEQHLEHWQAQAKFALMKECTNSVTGLRQIIDYNINDSDQNVAKWDASATVEFINHQGGVDRTLAIFKFSPWQDRLNCDRDRGREYELELAHIKSSATK